MQWLDCFTYSMFSYRENSAPDCYLWFSSNYSISSRWPTNSAFLKFFYKLSSSVISNSSCDYIRYDFSWCSIYFAYYHLSTSWLNFIWSFSNCYLDYISFWFSNSYSYYSMLIIYILIYYISLWFWDS